MNADILKEVNANKARVLIKSAGLRKKDEQVLIMRYVYGMSYQDISDILGITEKSVSNLVTKTRKLFQKYTEES